MDFLLDTSTISFTLRGHKAVTERFKSAIETGRVYCSTITEGELLYGALRRGHVSGRELLEGIALLVGDLTDVLAITREVAVIYAEVRTELEALGRMIPANDLWIAATAVSRGMTLVAHDEHFRRVDRLILEDWYQP